MIEEEDKTISGYGESEWFLERGGERIIPLPKPEILYREMKIELKIIEKHVDEIRTLAESEVIAS